MAGPLANREISVESVLSGSTCSPLTLREFRAYLKYKEFSVENLDFYIWYNSYKARFAALPKNIQELSPPVENSFLQYPSVLTHTYYSLKPSLSKLSLTRTTTIHSDAPPELETILGSAVSADRHLTDVNFSPLNDPSSESPSTSANARPSSERCFIDPSIVSQQSPSSPSFSTIALQPLRTEVDNIVSLFFTKDSNYELNLPSDLLTHIQTHTPRTTHPSTFTPVVHHVYQTLSQSSFPHFLSLASENVNVWGKIERLCLSAVFLILWVILEVVLILRIHERWVRIAGLPLLASAVACGSAASLGICLNNVWTPRKQLHQYEIWMEIRDEIGDDGTNIIYSDLAEEISPIRTSRNSISKSELSKEDELLLKDKVKKRLRKLKREFRTIEDGPIKKRLMVVWRLSVALGVILGIIVTAALVAIPIL